MVTDGTRGVADLFGDSFADQLVSRKKRQRELKSKPAGSGTQQTSAIASRKTADLETKMRK